MINEERKEDLSSVYMLLNRVSNLAILRTAFSEHIKVGFSLQDAIISRH